MESLIVSINPQKLGYFYKYLMLGLIVAQWMVVPTAVAIYRYVLARSR